MDDILKEFLDNGAGKSSYSDEPLSLINIHLTKYDEFVKRNGTEKVRTLLQNVEKVIKKSLRRKTDTLISHNGDISVLLFDTDRKHLTVVKNRLENAVQAYLENSSHNMKSLKFSFMAKTYSKGVPADEISL